MLPVPEKGSETNVSMMNPAANKSKREWRAAFKAVLDGMDAEARLAGSERICEFLRRSGLWNESRVVLLYYPTVKEPDILPLLLNNPAHSCQLKHAFPRYNSSTLDYDPCLIENAERDFQAGRFGIMEPKTACKIVDGKSVDMILIPGVGFNVEGVRIGHGNGFYDRICMKVSGVRIGIAFDEQVVSSKLPIEPHDVAMDFLVTPKGGIIVTGLSRGQHSFHRCDRP